MNKRLLTSVSVFFFLLMGKMMAGTISYKVTNYQIVPQPKEIIVDKQTDKCFRLDASTQIYVSKRNDGMQKNAQFLAEYIRQQTGLQLAVTNKKPAKNAILLENSLKSSNKEAYELQVNETSVRINGASDAGTFYGIQTFRKMIPHSYVGTYDLVTATIKDEPRFGYRGMMLDVGRHFFTVDEVKSYIDMLAMHNMNVFHWHLSEDQGWRIEIKKYPKLIEIGSVRKETILGHYGSGVYDGTPYGGYYTQEQAKEIVRYAADRHITVIPEIDLPGHMMAALASYPELGCVGSGYEVRTTWGIADDVLCAGNPKTLEFIKDVLGEIVDIFPSKYIHIGGDECPKVRWESCPKCQAKIAELGLKTDGEHTKEQRLQSYITTEADKFLTSKGRRLIGWNEILEGGLSPNATVMSWIGEQGGIAAAKLHHDVIMSPNTYLYFDYYQSENKDQDPLAIGGYLPLKRVYQYEPLPEELTKEQQKYIIGVQANLWTEYIGTIQKAFYMALPRAAALSEVQWSSPQRKDFADFLTRMGNMTSLYDMQRWNYSPSIFDVQIITNEDKVNRTFEVKMEALPGATIYYTTDGSTPNRGSFIYKAPLKIHSECTVKAWVVYPFRNGRVVTETLKFSKK